MAGNLQVLNGNRYGWSSLELGVDGVDQPEVQELSYKPTQDIGKMRGKGNRVLGTTDGESDAEGKMVLGLKQATLLEKQLGNGFMRKKFPMTVSYDEDGEGGIVTDELVGVQIIGREVNPKVGTDPITVTYDLHIMQLKLNGIDPHEEP